MSTPRRVAASLLLMLSVSACGPSPDAESPEIIVFGAASTAAFVEEIAERFEAETGTRVRLNFAGSATLARQIMSGAPADVFLSAHPEWMDDLETRGLIDATTRRDLLANDLVLAIPIEDSLGLVVKFRTESTLDFADAWPGRFAIGDPDSVPVGRYARQALTTFGWWEGAKDRVVPAAHAGAVVRLIEMREVAWGIVYASDAGPGSSIAAVGIFPPGSHDPIRYPVAACRDARPGAAAFVDALSTPEALAHAETLGFRPVPAHATDHGEGRAERSDE